MRITLRLPDSIYTALSARAGVQARPVGTQAMIFIAQGLGMELGPRNPGTSGLPRERRVAIATAAAAARWGQPAEKKTSRKKP